jgi:hypothetical protein
LKRRSRPDEPLFRFLTVDAADVGRYPSAIDDMRERRLDGMILRGVLSQAEIAAVLERLERRDLPVPRNTFPGFPEDDTSPYVVGRAIVSCSADLEDYFRDAADFRRCLPALFPGEPSFEARLGSIFSALAGGRPTSVPAGPRGTTYTPATIRVLPDGHEIGVHVGKSFLRMPQARHLSTLVEVGEQLSYFLTLTTPESGGELVIYGLEWADVEPHLPEPGKASGADVYMPTSAVSFIDACDQESYRPGEGDLLIFDGGRYFHRVSHIGGPRPRRTIGGFLSLSRDHRAVSYWS